MSSIISLEGLYRYNRELFRGLNVPEGVDKNVVIETICSRTREMELLYPDFRYLQNRITIWSKKNQITWKKLYDTTVLSYNPIENYDRMEEWSDNRTENLSSTEKNTKSNTNSNTLTNALTESRNDTNTHQNVAFNSGLAVDEKTGTNGTTRNTGTQKNSAKSNDTENRNKTDKNTDNTVHKGRIHGNVGVTTSQQMIEEDRRIVSFTVADYISEQFMTEFCIMVY